MPVEFNKPITIRNFKGMFTLFESSNIPDQYVANALNTSFADGSISPVKQYSTFGNQLTTDDDVGRILSSFTATKANGLEVPLRVRDNDTNTILEWYNSVDDEWDTLLAGLTTGKRIQKDSTRK